LSREDLIIQRQTLVANGSVISIPKQTTIALHADEKYGKLSGYHLIIVSRDYLLTPEACIHVPEPTDFIILFDLKNLRGIHHDFPFDCFVLERRQLFDRVGGSDRNCGEICFRARSISTKTALNFDG
jgi:hypothetical protein